MKTRYKILITSCVCVIIFIFLILYFNIPRLKYEYSDEYNGYLVSKAYGNSKSYNIPEYYNDKLVVGTSSRAFYKHDKLESIIFENSKNIIVIGRLSFAECKNLKSIDLKYTKYIERGAFIYDFNLDDLIIGANDIGGSSFYKCSSLVNVTLLNTKTIGSMAFSETSIENITIPKSVELVGNNCFYNCKKLSCINLYQETLKKNEYLNELDNINVIGE